MLDKALLNILIKNSIHYENIFPLILTYLLDNMIYIEIINKVQPKPFVIESVDWYVLDIGLPFSIYRINLNLHIFFSFTLSRCNMR